MVFPNNTLRIGGLQQKLLCPLASKPCDCERRACLVAPTQTPTSSKKFAVKRGKQFHSRPSLMGWDESKSFDRIRSRAVLACLLRIGALPGELAVLSREMLLRRHIFMRLGDTGARSKNFVFNGVSQGQIDSSSDYLLPSWHLQLNMEPKEPEGVVINYVN